MSILIKQIINRNIFEGAELVAGLSGKDNEVHWINIMEILDFPQSVQKGELLITTGYNLEDEEAHKNLIHELKERGVAGMAIQLGYYIKSVPVYIKKTANECGFPIVVIPSRYTFSAISHTLMEELLFDEYKQPTERIDVLCKKMKNEILEEKMELDESYENFLFLIKQNENDIKRTYKEDVNNAINSIRSFLETQPEGRLIYMEEAHNVAFLLQIPKKKAQQNIIFELTILLTFTSEQQHINFFVGVDNIHKVDEIETAFEHDMECIRVLQSIGAKRGVAPYNNLTFFEIFSTLRKNNSSILLGNDSIQNLLAYDNRYQTSYVQTLRVYLAYGCNVSKTAERLFIHRHTLMNRLNKIENMCEISFEDYYTRTYISLALVIHDYFAL